MAPTIPRKIQGALALVPPTEEETVDYNGKMGALVSTLQGTPEQREKDELLAWGSGLDDPSGNGRFGGGLTGANAAQLKQRNHARDLEVSYTPLIMDALIGQQRNAQLSRLAGAGGKTDAGGLNFHGMPLNSLPGIAVATGQKLPDLLGVWKAANQPDAVQGGSYQRFPQADGTITTQFYGDPTKGLTVDQAGQVSNMPGAVEAQARAAGAVAGAETRGKKQFDFVEGVRPDGTPYRIPLSAERPEWFGGNIDPTPQRAPGQAPTQPRAGSGAPPTARNNGYVTRGGPGQPAAQASRDGEARQVIQAELDKAEAPATRDRYTDEDRASLRREIARFGGAPAAGAAAPVVTAGDPGMPQGAVQSGISPRTKIANDSMGELNTNFIKNSYDPTLQAGELAIKNMDAIASARLALKGMTTGWSADAVTTGANILGALGVPQAKERAASAQVFQQAANQGIQQRLALQKGPQTDQDANRDAATWATIKNTPKANRYILDMAQAMAERDKLKADYYRKATPLARESGADLTEVDRRWARVMPSVFTMPSMRPWNKKD